ncbi:MAG: efflux RND transporter permease subunit [Acidobacteria bacterium]|nr:efflux RND transporter permease subunit [Acidobacteriota bacterium]MDW7983057.1 efflux RND transporter permease subunit [Acidobacteriota bacterium]
MTSSNASDRERRGVALFVYRPVLATMIVAFLVTLGWVSFRGLPIDLFPNVEFPVVTVITALPGASPEEIESTVTKPLEEAINTASGIEELRSYSQEGLSTIVVSFVLEKDPLEAVQDVRDKVNSVLSQLPTGTKPPIISRLDFGAVPILYIVVSSPRDLRETTEIARKLLKEPLETVSGVGSIVLFGGRERVLQVDLIVDRLRAFDLPVVAVWNAIQAQNLEYPGGRLTTEDQETGVRLQARVRSAEDLANLAIAERNGAILRLKDVAVVRDGFKEPRQLSRLWIRGRGDIPEESVTLVVFKQARTNTVQVIEAVKARLTEIRQTLPPDIQTHILSDQSRFIRESIRELQIHLILGAVLASLVVFVFLRNWQATLISALAIPTSLIATFIFMGAFGYSLNTMTLLGLTVAVGIVIDDAIVVIENIFRHMEEYGVSAFQAAIRGFREIALAVTATTFSLVIIFLPIAFLKGRAGLFLRQFGWTSAVAILFSLLIAYVLTPMLASRLLRPQKVRSKGTGFYRWIEAGYVGILRWSLRHRWVVVLIAALCVLSTGFIARWMGKEFIASDDTGEFAVSLEAPPGSALETTDRLLLRIFERIRNIPEIQAMVLRVGDITAGSEAVYQGNIYVQLVDYRTRRRSQFDIMREIREVLGQFPELRAQVTEATLIGGAATGGWQFPVNVVLTGPDLDVLESLARHVMDRMRATPGFASVDSSIPARLPEFQVRVLYDRAQTLGVRAQDVALTLRLLLGGDEVSSFREGVDRYGIWLRLRPEDRQRLDDVLTLPVPSLRGANVELRNVAQVEYGVAPAAIQHWNRSRVVNVLATLDGLDLGRALDVVRQAFAEVRPSPAYELHVLGRGKIMAETFANFLTAFGLAFVFMYIILAAQFEHFLHPVTILLSIPLTLPFALLSLWLWGENLGLYGLMGTFLLAGVVKKNGILQVDYTNRLRSQGLSRWDALIEANRTRLRPILMTTFTLVMGMVPIALGQGPGAASRASLAKAIVGGQLLSLLITLLIVPVGYSLFDDLTGWVRRRVRRVVPTEAVTPAASSGSE